MTRPLQAIRGMNDLLPEALGLWQRIERAAAAIFAAYGYREIRLPLLEATELFRRSIGEVTDIVEKEMYSFEDRNGDNLTLRPEGTAGCVRAGIEHGLLHNQVQRLWYGGPMFRHERPQKGRYRQFHQLGVEAFGIAGPDLEAEQILMCDRLWRSLGLNGLTLELNTLGTVESRIRYRERLVAYLERHLGRLDPDSRRRLHTNPLRVLDSKNPDMQAIIAGAPALADDLDPESGDHFARLCGELKESGLAYRVNPRLVRGLDYYNRTVFEWTTAALGAQGTVCAGGRYDGLVAQLGGQSTPAAGFALGLERLVELARQQGIGGEDGGPQICLIVAEGQAESVALGLGEALRSAGLRVLGNCGGSLKSQLRRADRSGAEYALLLGERERAGGSVSIKPLRSGEEQSTVTAAQAVAMLRERLVRPC